MFKLKKTVLVVAFTLFSSSLTSPAISGDLRGEMNHLFFNMTNYTQPGVFESTRRGVISGGGITTRTRTMTIQLASFEPPNIKAGCGGIDIFMGSFSYINKDQFISFLRAIAANAAGYAFQMALGVSCSLCKQVISGMQTIAQNINDTNMNSCQIAKGFVDGGRAAIANKHDMDASLDNVNSGYTTDQADERSSATQGRETKLNKDPLFAEEYLGNIVWKTMTKKAVNDWFNLPPDDTSMKEVLMSISGTVVREKPIDSKDGKVFPVKTYPGGLVKLRDLIEGSQRNLDGEPSSQTLIYSCKNDKNDCMAPQRTKALNIQGLANQIQDALEKPDGIIHKFAKDKNAAFMWTAQERALISNIPIGVGTAIRNLALGSESAAKTISGPASRVIALSMTHSLMEELLMAIEAAFTGMKDEEFEEVKGLIKDAKARLEVETRELSLEYGNVHNILESAEKLQSMMVFDHPLVSKNPMTLSYGSGATE